MSLFLFFIIKCKAQQEVRNVFKCVRQIYCNFISLRYAHLNPCNPSSFDADDYDIYVIVCFYMFFLCTDTTCILALPLFINIDNTLLYALLLYVLCNSWHAALPTHWIWTHEIEILDPWNWWKKAAPDFMPCRKL